jgi:DNA primase
MAIPQAFIDELMARVDIVEVIDARVPLKKAGRDYAACCPFHTEKTPSFTVSPEKQFYHCFGCGAHGTALGFLMEYEHLSFPEAVEELARSVGMPVPRDGRPAPRDDADLYALLERVAALYAERLRRDPGAERARRYLTERGLDREVVERFGIGYAPPGWDTLMRSLNGDRKLQQGLIKTGMLIEKDDGRSYDRFRDRIMFPIRDRRGRTLGFGGRALGDAKPKYLNSPETPLFHKGRELYGLYQALRAKSHPERLLVVEGYMDVVALAQFGIDFAVATLGTSTTADHLKHLFRACSTLVFCFDGDRAGRDAAWRALEAASGFMEEGRQVGFLLLPEGEDPDTLVRKIGPEAFRERVDAARSFSDFLFEGLGSQTDTSTLEGRARLVELARPLLDQVPDGVLRRMLLERLAQISSLRREELATLLRRPPDRRAPVRTATPPVAPGERRGVRPPREGQGGSLAPRSLLYRAMYMLLCAPDLAHGVASEDLELLRSAPGEWTAILVEMLDLARGGPHIGSGSFLEHWRGTTTERVLAKLARTETALSAELFPVEFGAAVVGLLQELVRQRIDALVSSHRLGEVDAAARQELQDLYRRSAELGRRRRGD